MLPYIQFESLVRARIVAAVHLVRVCAVAAAVRGRPPPLLDYKKRAAAFITLSRDRFSKAMMFLCLMQFQFTFKIVFYNSAFDYIKSPLRSNGISTRTPHASQLICFWLRV